MGKKSVEGISAIVSNAMARNTCSMHNLSITSVCLDTLQLGCSKCFRQNQINIIDLVKNPIQAVINNLENKTCFREVLHDLQTHNLVKSGFEALIQQIRSSINIFCDEALEDYRNKWQRAFSKANQMIAQIKTAQAHYRKVFQELLQSKFQQGTVYQLETCLCQFRNQCSQDPTDYLKSRIQCWSQSTKHMPIVDWNNLKSIYETLTDSELLNKQTFFKHSYIEHTGETQEQTVKIVNTLVPQIKNKLKRKQHYAKFDSQSLVIYKEEGGTYQKIAQLKQNNDTYLDIGKNTLIGINYGGVSFYKYGFGKIFKTKTYQFLGCLNLLVFSQCLIIEAEGRINRLWLSDGFREVICLAGSDIAYTKKPYEFSYKNSKSQILIHSALHTQR